MKVLNLVDLSTQIAKNADRKTFNFAALLNWSFFSFFCLFFFQAYGTVPHAIIARVTSLCLFERTTVKLWGSWDWDEPVNGIFMEECPGNDR